MTESEVDRIERIWTEALADFPGLSIEYLHKRAAGGVLDIAGVCQALRAAWAETARVTKELQEAESRETLLLPGRVTIIPAPANDAGDS